MTQSPSNPFHQTTGWQPIETAPRDGSRILLWHADLKLAISGCWHNDPGRDDPSAYEPAWAWWCADEDVVLWDDDRTPSHWMPLEEPR